MLVLTRKVGERIRIGDDVVVTVVKINGNAVRLGVEAPAHLDVVRAEIDARTARIATSPSSGDTAPR